MAPLSRQCLDEKQNPNRAKRTAEGSRDGGWVVLLSAPSGRVFLRPSRVGGGEDPSVVRLLQLEALHSMVAFLRGPGAGAMAERIRQTPVADGGFEAAPAASVMVTSKTSATGSNSRRVTTQASPPDRTFLR